MDFLDKTQAAQPWLATGSATGGMLSVMAHDWGMTMSDAQQAVTRSTELGLGPKVGVIKSKKLNRKRSPTIIIVGAFPLDFT